jgi:hypothetical protein
MRGIRQQNGAKLIRPFVTFLTQHPSSTDYSQPDFHSVGMGDDHEQEDRSDD